MAARSGDRKTPAAAEALDVLVVGLGFAGVYAVHHYREMGLAVLGVERAADVGGVWYHNRYPGARCDVRSIDYSYSFSEALQREWRWTETFASQPEILAYINHVVERFDLRRDMAFNVGVKAARWDEDAARWRVETDCGRHFACRYLVFATGGLSAPKEPDFEGLGRFRGESYQTSRWPHEPVSFKGKRVGVIGTGSSGLQIIPKAAAEAERLTVFQRTPVFTVPARNGPIDQTLYDEIKARYADYRREMKASRAETICRRRGASTTT